MMTPPILFPCAVLLNANRVGSTGKRTRLGVQVWFETTVQIFKLCACPLDPLNPHSAIQHNKMKMGISDEVLVSVPQTHLSWICEALKFNKLVAFWWMIKIILFVLLPNPSTHLFFSSQTTASFYYSSSSSILLPCPFLPIICLSPL